MSHVGTTIPIVVVGWIAVVGALVLVFRALDRDSGYDDNDLELYRKKEE